MNRLFKTALAACALSVSAAALADTFVASIYTQNDIFMDSYVKALKENAAKAGDRLLVTYAQEDLYQEQNQLELATLRGASALIVNPVAENISPSYAIDAAKAAGDLPVVFINRRPQDEFLNSYDKAFYVGTDAAQSGRYQVEIINSYLLNHSEADRNGDGEIAYFLLQGELNTADTIERTASLESGMLASPYTFKELGRVTARWQAAEAFKVTGDFLTRNKIEDVEFIIANNDDMALGALQYLKTLGYNSGDPEKFIPIVGIDGMNAALAAIENGEMTGTVKNDFEAQARIAFKLAKLAASGEKVDSESLGYSLYQGKGVYVPYLKITH